MEFEKKTRCLFVDGYLKDAPDEITVGFYGLPSCISELKKEEAGFTFRNMRHVNDLSLLIKRCLEIFFLFLFPPPPSFLTISSSIHHNLYIYSLEKKFILEKILFNSEKKNFFFIYSFLNY